MVKQKKALPGFWDQDLTAFRDYTDAFLKLYDLARLHDNPSSLAALRSSISREQATRFGSCTEHFLLVSELEGICKAIHRRFELQMRARSLQKNYLLSISWRCILLHQSLYERHISSSSSSSSSTDGALMEEHDKSIEHYLFRSGFAWTYAGLVRDGPIKMAKSCFCPTIACLQHCISNTTVVEWLVAAKGGREISPLAFAWDLARRDPQVGKVTADVVVLVQMGWFLCSLADIAAKREAFDRAYVDPRQLSGVCSSAVGRKSGASRKRWGERVKNHAIRALVWFDEPFVEAKESLKKDKSEKCPATTVESDPEAKHLIKVQAATTSLIRSGDRYARCIQSQASAQSREDIVFELRKDFKVLMCTAKPDWWGWGEKWHANSLKEFLAIVDKLGKAE